MTHDSDDTKSGQILERLRDLEWHCAAHDLTEAGTSQPAGHIRDLRNAGYQLETDRVECDTCDSATTHYRLLVLEQLPGVRLKHAVSPRTATTSTYRLDSGIRQIERGIESGNWETVQLGLNAIKVYAERLREGN